MNMHQKDRSFERAMGMSGPTGALGYYWLQGEVPPAWIFLTWLGFSFLLLLLSFRR